jgi:hypothetical protein
VNKKTKVTCLLVVPVLSFVLAICLQADKDYPGTDLRLIAGWVNPANPGKGMIIYTAQKAEDIPGINRIPHGMTQLVIARGQEILKHGFFKKGEQGFAISDAPDLELPILSQQQIEEDFDALAEIVKETMPTIVANKKIFGIDVFGILKGVNGKIAGITSTEQFISLLAEAIGSCKGSHFHPARLGLQKYQANKWLRELTEGFIDEASVRVHENYLPFLESRSRLSPLDLSLLYFEGNCFTLYDFVYEGSIYPRGLKVLRCNGETPAQVVSRIQNRLDNMLPWDVERNMFYTEEFYRPGEIDKGRRLEFEFQVPSGEILHAVFPAGSTVVKKTPQRDVSKQVRYLDQESSVYPCSNNGSPGPRVLCFRHSARGEKGNAQSRGH